jgi:peptide/nickel transport system substrate-binding protein
MCKKLLLILVLSVLVASTSVGCAPSTLTILSITEGDVFVMKAGTGNWIEAQVGMSLEPGDSVRTGDNSSAEITFFEGSTMELEAGTEIEIASLEIAGEAGVTAVTVEETIGSMIFRVTKIVDPASRYEVETPAGVVAVRGSVVQVYVIEDGTTWATNLEGDIWAVAQGVELQVPQGQQCIISPGQPPTLSGSFVQMTIADVDSLDPAWGYDTASGEQVQYIYETLLCYDGEKTDQFVPVLATEWQFDSENVSYRFKIRDSVEFQNGDDLTSEDVEYSFERAMVQDRQGGPIWMFYTALLGLNPREFGNVGSRDGDGNIQVTFDQIDDAVEVDGDWVVFHLSDLGWRLPFLQILCGPWASVVDKEWCIAHGEWDGTANNWTAYNNPDKTDSYLYNHTNGTGPWKLEEWDPGAEIKLVRNNDYWREPAAFESVITQIVDEWTTRKQALLAGHADLIYVPRDYIGELEGIDALNVHKDLPQLSFNVFCFNMAINSASTYIGSGTLDGEGIPANFFTDADVRKGFNYAFDWTTYIRDALAGEGKQVGSPVIEGLPFYNPDASMYSHDLAQAKEHLKVAWDGEVWEKGFRFTLLYDPGNLAGGTACKILTENLAAINPKFQVSILPVNFATGILPNINGGFLPMFQIGWIFDYPHPDDVAVPFMASYGVIAEWQGYGYPELDQSIEEAFKELDPAVQQDMYYEIQERYYEDAPSIMLCQSLSRRYFTKYMHGFYFNPAIASYAGPLYYMSKSLS